MVPFIFSHFSPAYDVKTRPILGADNVSARFQAKEAILPKIIRGYEHLWRQLAFAVKIDFP